MLIAEIVSLLVVAALLIYFFSRQSKIIKQQRAELEATLKSVVAPPRDESGKLEDEKKKLEEKNKKLFSMSEAVYKEKKKVDEENAKLQQEKEKLAVEKTKVDEKVKKLWSQSMAIHKEKERINELKLLIEYKHKEVMDSVTYAKRIQDAILPEGKEILSSFPDSFVLFKPRDIVSGDFYWYSKQESAHFIAAVDCTGHGVPGAFMSMIGNTLLNQIVNEKGILDPGEILRRLNEEVNHALKQTHADSESRDGMDIALCRYDFEKMELQFAGANRPMYLVRNGQLEEIKPDKFPIGGRDYDVPKNFNSRIIPLAKGMSVYVSTDGYADQFSPDDRKLMTKNFKNLLLSSQEKPMAEQKRFLSNYLEGWRGTMEQTDDILVIGIQV